MATLTIGTINDDAAITVDSVFNYTATGGETFVLTTHLCAVNVIRVWDDTSTPPKERREGTIGNTTQELTSVVPAASEWRFEVIGDATPNRYFVVETL